MKKKLATIFALILILQFCLPQYVFALKGEYIPDPQTEYAKAFITKCENQTWFINEVERLLNMQQKTLDEVKSSTDFDIIKSLGLKNSEIEGVIPESIGELKELRHVFLSGNKLSGNIPASFFNLPKLENLDLSSNNYTGYIPENFGTMHALTSLVLSNNKYKGNIPTNILNNTNIKILDLSDNMLTESIPLEISNMIGLFYLNLSGNKLGGSIPDLSALTSLKTLSLWNCHITGLIHDSIYTLTDLQVLDLAQNRLTGNINNEIKNLISMEFLTFDNNKLEGEIPTTISDLIKLEKINLSNNKLYGNIPDSFGMINLNEIYLENNFLKGNIPNTLKTAYDNGCKVFLKNNYLTGEILKSMINNEKNFTDEAHTEQYQLGTFKNTVQIKKDNTLNIYLLLKNTSLLTGNTFTKLRLLPTDYTLTYDNTQLEINIDNIGIHVKALMDIPKLTAVKIDLNIKDNNNSAYSKASISVTTDIITPPTPSDSTDSTPAPPPPVIEPKKEIHIPYINGYPDNSFGAENMVTREQVAKMIATALDIEKSNAIVSSYNDVINGHWSLPYIESVTERQYLKGYNDGLFKPSANITRAEMATCLVRIAKQQGQEIKGNILPFADIDSQAWYIDEVNNANMLGIIKGYSDNTFRPKDKVTRAEAVTMISRILNRDPKTAIALQNAQNPFFDVDKTHWAYLYILESSIKHEH